MKNMKVLGSAILSLALVAGNTLAVPVYADGTKVVTLGADLTDEQKQTMLNYFKTNSSESQIITITNQDEREHLSGYVPIEQIGTRTVSCAYVKPTSSGGIKVKTANLNWVTGNMIASSLSTSGVKNCEVVAACPFEVSGTGALTGIQMAYETATGTQLDESKKNLATQEIVVTGNLAENVGTTEAAAVINDSKIDIIQNNITDTTEITNVVTNVVTENNVSVSQEQLDEIVDLLKQIAEEGYNYEDVADTLENVEQNTSGTSEEQSSDETEETDEDSIVNNTDESVLGEDIVVSSTEDQSLEEETYSNDSESEDDEWETFETEESDNTEDEWEILETEEGGDTTEEENTDTDEFTDEYVEYSEEQVNEGDTASVDPTEEDVTEERTSKEDALSEQSRSQYDKAVKFISGELRGDSALLYETMGEDYIASIIAADLLDGDTISILEEMMINKYLDILYTGAADYVVTGTESYMSTELNAVNQYLKQLFHIDGETLSEETDRLENVAEEYRQLMYNDFLKFFENLYGESTQYTGETESAEYYEESYEESYENAADEYEYTEEEYTYDE